MRDRLSRAESVLREALANGGDADLGRDIDPRAADGPRAWEPGRVVRAEVLEQLLRDGDVADGAAVQLTGVRIEGALRIHYGRLTRSLRLDLCWIDDAVSLRDLTTGGIELVRCRIPTLRAESVDIDGALNVRECDLNSVVLTDTRVHRSASFEDSRIASDATPFHARNFVVGGDLMLNRARIFAGHGEAVHAERLQVASELGLTGLRARGAVKLSGASIGGRVDASNAVLRNGTETAFDGEHLSAAGLVGDGLRCTGTMDLNGATINGVLSLDGAVLACPGGDALNAGDIEADVVRALHGTRIRGRVVLRRAVIRDILALRGADVRNRGGQAVQATGARVGALNADRAQFEGRVILGGVDASFVRFVGASVHNPDDVASFSLEGAVIRRDLRCENMTVHGTVAMQRVRVGAAAYFTGARITGGKVHAIAASRCVVGERLVIGPDAVVQGDIDLAHADIGKSLVMDAASIYGTLRLFQAHVRSDVLMRGTYIETHGMGIDGIGLTVDGRFTCRGMVCDGAVRLTAVTADAVVMTGAQIHNPQGNALIASRIDVRGDLVVGNDPYSGDSGGFRAMGRVVFRDGRVGGDVIFDDAELSRPDHRALDVTSIHVGGKLSLEGTQVDGAAALDKAHVLRRMVLSAARFAGHGVGSAEGSVVFTALQATADELLVDGCTFIGGVRLTASVFAVGASMRDTTIDARGEVALLAPDMTCGVLRLERLDVQGEVTVTGSTVTSDVLVEGGSFANPGLAAIDASRVSVAGTLSVADAHIVGTLLLRRADIGFAVVLSSTTLAAGPMPRSLRFSPTTGLALTAAGIKVEGNIEVRGLNARGQLALRDAVVNGRMIVRDDCELRADGIEALFAPGLKVAGSIEIGQVRTDEQTDVQIVGGIRLDRCRTGELSFHHVSIAPSRGMDEDEPLVTLSDADVARRLSMDGLHVFAAEPPADETQADETQADERPVDVRQGETEVRPALVDLSELRAGAIELPQGDTAIDLRDAQVRSLTFDLADPETVLLSGLTFDDPGGADVDTALAWLRRDPTGFQHQAYEQLAAHYRRQGDETAARSVLLARQRHRRDLLGRSFGQLLTKAWGYVQDITVGYGYRPGLAAVWFLGLLAVGTVYFWGRAVQPAFSDSLLTFNPFGYALDLLIPLVNLGQDLAWDPIGSDLVVAYGLTFAGAVLATTIAAAVTRVLARR